MSGLTPFSYSSKDYFAASYKKLLKTRAGENRSTIDSLISGLINDPFGHGCGEEPRPAKLKLAEDLQFYKLKQKIAQHASGQIRIMYLVNKKARTIYFLLIYSHEQFAKRPHDQEIINAVQEFFSG